MLVVDRSPPHVEPVRLVVGESEEGRPIEAFVVGDPQARRRALVIGGQHGDEPLGVEAVRRVMDDWRPNADEVVAFVPCVNPDGLAADSRVNARGIDLNRDHQRLRSAEARAIHALARDFTPALVVDVHTFKARRRRLLTQGYEWGADVMFELDNHPGRLLAYPKRWSTWIVPVIDVLARRGIRSDRYMIATSSGKVRTSSADIVDARNGLAARVEATGVLIEGREPTRQFGSMDRTRQAMYQALTVILQHWRQVDESLTERQPVLHLVAKRLGGGPSASAFTVTPADGYPRRRLLPGRPFLELLPARPVVVPCAYGIDADNQALVGLLQRHGFVATPKDQAHECIGAEEVAVIESLRPSQRTERSPRTATLRWYCQSPNFRDRLFFRTDQPGGEHLAALLEPGSRFGVHRFDEFGLPLVANRYYAAVRGLGRRVTAAS